MKKTYSCGAVVWRQSTNGLELLLIKQLANKESWGIPKGHINENETHEQCALREVREETGIAIVLSQKLPNIETFWDKKMKIIVSFLATQVGDDVPNIEDPECEVADVKWWPIDNLPQIQAYQRPLIVYVIDILKRIK